MPLRNNNVPENWEGYMATILSKLHEMDAKLGMLIKIAVIGLLAGFGIQFKPNSPIDWFGGIENVFYMLSGMVLLLGIWMGVQQTRHYKRRTSIKKANQIDIFKNSVRQLERICEKQDKRYKDLFENSVEGIVVTDIQGNILDANKAYQKMLGYSIDELRGLRYQDLTPKKWHKLEHEIVEKVIMAKGYSEPYRKEYKTKDGTIFPIEIRVWLTNNGEQGMWGIVRDISLEKASFMASVKAPPFISHEGGGEKK